MSLIDYLRSRRTTPAPAPITAPRPPIPAPRPQPTTSALKPATPPAQPLDRRDATRSIAECGCAPRYSRCYCKTEA